jgi:uncharacterized protein (DUF2267 family)
MMQRTDESTAETSTATSRARFLAAIEEEAALPSYVKPDDAAIATMRAVLDRLTPGQAHALVVSLPSDVRAIFDRVCREREGRRTSQGGLVELVDRIGEDLGLAPASAELIACAVFRALRELLPFEVSAHVAQQLPTDLRAAWLSSVPGPTTVEVAGDLDLMRQILADIEKTGTLSLRMTAREAFSSVMCIFAQRLSGGETKDLLLGLPRTIRPLVDRCMLERRERPLSFGVDELVANVALDLDTELEDAEAIVAAVFAAVTRILPREELDHVASQLPEDLRTLWLA